MRRAGPKLTREGFMQALDGMKDFDVGGYIVGFSPNNHNGSSFVELTVIGRDSSSTTERSTPQGNAMAIVAMTREMGSLGKDVAQASRRSSACRWCTTRSSTRSPTRCA